MPLKSALNIRPKSILFATDLSPASRNALRHALALARHYGATLHLAHIICSMGFTLAGPGAIALAEEAARRDLQTLEYDPALRDRFAAVRHDSVVSIGEIWGQIQRLLEEDAVDMLVIGTHGRCGLGRLFLGSVAEKLFRCAECPVITVGPSMMSETGVENMRQPRPVLFATDFKAASLAALPYAVTFAQERKVKLVLLHVVTATELDRHPAQEHVSARLQLLMRDYASLPVQFECVTRIGDPAEEILKLATSLKADVIGMGLHRTRYVQAVSHFRQSIAYKVVGAAPCAVFTARD